MSTIITDTITGKSTATTITIGSTPVVSSSANSMTIRGEGSAQTSIQQGLAKVWIHHNQVSSHSIYDSFNVSSLADAATGHTAISFTTNMANNDYAGSHHTNGHSSADNFNIGGPGALINRVTSSMDHRSYISSGYSDSILNDNTAHGDLA
jgi:hypothetical protein